jgi:hypothetical protein
MVATLFAFLKINMVESLYWKSAKLIQAPPNESARGGRAIAGPSTICLLFPQIWRPTYRAQRLRGQGSHVTCHRGACETAARREASVEFVDDPIITSLFDVLASHYERDDGANLAAI